MLKPQYIFLNVLAMVVAIPSFGAVIKGRISDITDGTTPLADVTVEARFVRANGSSESPLTASNDDGSYSLQVDSNTNVRVYFYGGPTLAPPEKWAVKTGGDDEIHTYNLLMFRRSAVEMRDGAYFVSAGQTIANQSQDVRNDYLNWVWTSPISTISKVQLAKSMASHEEIVPGLPGNWQALALQDLTEVRKTASNFEIFLSLNRQFPSPNEILFNPAPEILTSLIIDSLHSRPELSRQIFMSAEENWSWSPDFLDPAGKQYILSFAPESPGIKYSGELER